VICLQIPSGRWEHHHRRFVFRASRGSGKTGIRRLEFVRGHEGVVAFRLRAHVGRHAAPIDRMTLRLAGACWQGAVH